MNEQIRQLAEQAEMAANKGDHVDVKIMMVKFAQLIVGECQRRVEQYINECGEVASMPDTVIMKHFGVEE